MINLPVKVTKSLKNKALSGLTLTLKMKENLNQQIYLNYFIFNRPQGVQNAYEHFGVNFIDLVCFKTTLFKNFIHLGYNLL